MATKAAYQKRMEAQLKEWDARFELWSAKAGKATASARVNYENELESLKSKRETAQKALEKLGKRGDNAWEDMKDRAESIWDDMSKSMENAATRFK